MCPLTCKKNFLLVFLQEVAILSANADSEISLLHTNCRPTCFYVEVSHTFYTTVLGEKFMVSVAIGLFTFTKRASLLVLIYYSLFEQYMKSILSIIGPAISGTFAIMMLSKAAALNPS